MTKPPSAKIKNPTFRGTKNPLRFKAFVFIPKNIVGGKRYLGVEED